MILVAAIILAVDAVLAGVCVGLRRSVRKLKQAVTLRDLERALREDSRR